MSNASNLTLCCTTKIEWWASLDYIALYSRIWSALRYRMHSRGLTPAMAVAEWHIWIERWIWPQSTTDFVCRYHDIGLRDPDSFKHTINTIYRKSSGWRSIRFMREFSYVRIARCAMSLLLSVAFSFVRSFFMAVINLRSFFVRAHDDQRHPRRK